MVTNNYVTISWCLLEIDVKYLHKINFRRNIIRISTFYWINPLTLKNNWINISNQQKECTHLFQTFTLAVLFCTFVIIQIYVRYRYVIILCHWLNKVEVLHNATSLTRIAQLCEAQKKKWNKDRLTWSIVVDILLTTGVRLPLWMVMLMVPAVSPFPW